MSGHVAIVKSIENYAITRAVQTLHGIVLGIVADASLHDLEIKMLATWLSANEPVCDSWPGAAISKHVKDILSDGVITEPEREHLLAALQEYVSADFATTGSVSPEPTRLPLEDHRDIQLDKSTVCHTGAFMYGTRTKCEGLTQKLGGVVAATVTRATDILVVGSRVSPHWVQESCGRKIMSAAEMRSRGHHICIISEQRWLKFAAGATT